MSGHHKNRGFSQTSKRFDGALKAQHQASRSKQVDHSADAKAEELAAENAAKNSSSDSKRPR